MTHQAQATKLTDSILEYFDSYRLATVAPIVCEIEAALKAAYAQGVVDGKKS